MERRRVPFKATIQAAVRQAIISLNRSLLPSISVSHLLAHGKSQFVAQMLMVLKAEEDIREMIHAENTSGRDGRFRCCFPCLGDFLVV